MKTNLTALLLAAALALTLAACGEKDIADTPLPDEPPEPVAEQPAADDEWIVLHADDVLLHEEPFTLCEGRTATLRLYGRQDGEYDCGVSRILLLWDDGGEQELRTADVGDDVWCTDGYTNCWTEDGGLAIGDYNFDGYTDLGLQIDTPAYNLPYYYWFYDAETASFQPYGSWTYQLEIDAENEACICQWHVTPEYYTDTYRPDGEGGLYLARRDTEVYYSADGVKSFTEVYAVNEQPLAYADLDRDGANEILVLTSSEPDEFAMRFYTLDAKNTTAQRSLPRNSAPITSAGIRCFSSTARAGTASGARTSCAISPTQARALLTTAMTCSRSPTLRARRSRVAPSSSRLPTSPTHHPSTGLRRRTSSASVRMWATCCAGTSRSSFPPIPSCAPTLRTRWTAAIPNRPSRTS